MRADFFAAVHWRSEIPKIDKIHLTKKENTFHNGGEKNWTIWTNMYNYQLIPIYLSLQWRNKSGRHFAAVQWRSEIPRTQWIIRQVCISVFVFAFVYWNCVCIFVFLSIGQNNANKIFLLQFSSGGRRFQEFNGSFVK